MDRTKEAIDRIRILECPTGELENRITEIMEHYGIANKDKVSVIRDSSLDKEEAQAYQIKIADEKNSILVLAKSGNDDYVAKVVDIFTGI